MGRKKRRSLLMTLITALALCLGLACACPAFAEERAADQGETPEYIEAALVVFEEDAQGQRSVIKIFTKDELQALKQQRHSYSTINNVGTVGIEKNLRGVAVDDILAAAGCGSISEESDRLVRFIGYDGVWAQFLSEQLFADRYYYPSIRSEDGKGNGSAASFQGRVAVPAMISIPEDFNESDEYRDGRLFLGQSSPTEQTNPVWVRGMARSIIKVDPYTGKKINGEPHEPGRIVIFNKDVQPSSWNAIKNISSKNNKWVPVGTKISIDRGANETPTSSGDRCWVYYTLDGSEPNLSSPLYNYQNKYYGMPNEKFNSPVISHEGKITLKMKVYGYGKKDSGTSTFQIIGARKPGTPKIKSISVKGKTITLKWTKVKDAKGYKIYRATKKKGKYKLVKTISKAKIVTWKNKKLKKKKTYYYKIVAYKTILGTYIYSNSSAVKYKKIK